MKIIKLTCPACGAKLEVDVSLHKAFCQYCGTQLLVDDEKHRIELDNAEELGYQFERGRIKAQQEAARRSTTEFYRQDVYYEDSEQSDLNRGTALLLCLFLGFFGAHYFYVRRFGMGLLYLFTGGTAGLGWIYDIIRIAAGGFIDDKGKAVR